MGDNKSDPFKPLLHEHIQQKWLQAYFVGLVIITFFL